MKNKFRTSFQVLTIFSLLLLASNIFAYEPPNLYQCKQAVIRYHDSGQYNRDIHAVITKAMDYVDHKVKENKTSTHPKKLAAVFDIDETSLSNYPYLIQMDFGGTSEQTLNLINRGDDASIPDSLALYQQLNKDGVKIFFVTGRPTSVRQSTIKNLNAVGYKVRQELFMEPENYKKPSVIPYKSGIRKEITHRGYEIILNIGDQWSDLKGGYADKSFKLPNPYYYIP